MDVHVHVGLETKCPLGCILIDIQQFVKIQQQ